MNVPVSDTIAIPDEFRACFDKQRAAWLAAPRPVCPPLDRRAAARDDTRPR